MQLLDRGLAVRAINEKLAALLEQFRRRDIGEDHALLDEPMRVQPFRGDDARHLAIGIQDDLALGQVEIERLAQRPGALQRGIRLPQRLQHVLEQRLCGLVGRAVDRGLGLRVGELGARAHHDPVQRVPVLLALRIDHHAHRECRPVFHRAQRAEIVGDALGQHRHDAIGEIDGIAALQRLAVERGARRHVGGNVGDGDGEHEAAGVGRIGIGHGVDRVVVVLGVGRVDGDERQRAPVLAMRHRRGLCGLRLGQRLRLEGRSGSCACAARSGSPPSRSNRSRCAPRPWPRAGRAWCP